MFVYQIIRMKKNCILFYISIASTYICTQQDPIFTQFWNNSTVFNPASTGLFYKHQTGINYRNQWVNMNGAPTTIFTSYNTRIDKYKSGFGFNYMYETIGAMKQNRFDLNYSYQLDLGDEKKLSFGLSAGIVNLNFEPYWVGTDLNDPLLPKSGQGSGFSSSTGIAFKSKKLHLGLSSTQINEANIKEIGFKFARHYYINASYDFNLSGNFSLKPQILFRTDGTFMSTDINLLAIFKKQYWLGITGRSRDSFAFMAGVDIKEKYRIGYSYDITVSKLNNGVSSGSHEITLGFFLK
jgi:type IX secretion system PorP/SprF family membrane protein